MTGLKPCPICGGNIEKDWFEYGPLLFCTDCGMMFWVECAGENELIERFNDRKVKE